MTCGGETLDLELDSLGTNHTFGIQTFGIHTFGIQTFIYSISKYLLCVCFGVESRQDHRVRTRQVKCFLQGASILMEERDEKIYKNQSVFLALLLIIEQVSTNTLMSQTASNPAPSPSPSIYGLEMQKYYIPRSRQRQTVEGQTLEFCLAQDQVPTHTSWETSGKLLTFSGPQLSHRKGG